EHRRAAIRQQRRHRAHVLAAGPLDLDHLGARLRQHQGGERTRQQRGEVENEDAGKGLRMHHGAMSPSVFIQRTLTRNASSVRATSSAPCTADTRPPGAPMMSTPLASIAMRSRWLRLALRTALSSLNPYCSGSNVRGSMARPFGFWKIRKADASP